MKEKHVVTSFLEYDNKILILRRSQAVGTYQGKWIVHPYGFRVEDPTRLRIDWEHKEAKWILPQDIVKYSTVPKLKETWERVENEN